MLRQPNTRESDQDTSNDNDIVSDIADDVNRELRDTFAPRNTKKVVAEVPTADYDHSIGRMHEHLARQAAAARGVGLDEARKEINTKMAVVHTLRAAARLMPYLENGGAGDDTETTSTDGAQ